MILDDIKFIRNDVKNTAPLIHAITNPISINQCANAILAVGARPVMAQHPREVCEITQSSQALVLNLGNITDTRMESMLICAKEAKRQNIPVVLDLVGIACSTLRRSFAKKLLENCTPGIIKGNYSEINALYDDSYKTGGVDACANLSKELISEIATRLAVKTGSVILASGKSDIIADDKKLIHIHNGTTQLALVTGTGCMLGMLAACYLTVSSGISAAICASSVLSISGEVAATDKGSGTFMLQLIDNISTLKDETIEKHLKMEVVKIERV